MVDGRWWSGDISVSIYIYVYANIYVHILMLNGLGDLHIHLNSSGHPWIQSNPFAAHLGAIGFQTTTINININNRFLLPRGGLSVCMYVYIYIYIKINRFDKPPNAEQ